MKKTDCILLVDDSLSTNIYNKKLIEKTGIANQVYDVHNGIEALNYLNKKGEFSEKECPKPNIIFLDINMPKMNGFEFLQNYAKLSKKKRGDMVVVFLTTSNWTKDKVKAIESDLVYDFIEKPLNVNVLQRINQYYLDNYYTEALVD